MSSPKEKTLPKQSESLEAAWKRTAARLSRIHSHLDVAPRGGKLKGKVCIITGVGSIKGIGRATSLLFAHEGAAHLYLLDFVEDNLPNLKLTIEQKYPDVKATVIKADAADEEAIEAVCQQAMKEEGRLDVFYANAGIATANVLAETSVAQFTEVMRINALSCFIALKHASAQMKKANASRGKEYGGGSIIMTASVAGMRSGAGGPDYSASKAAVNSLAQTGAWQLQRSDVRVNSVCPGLIETAMTVGTFDYARSRGNGAKIGQLNPMGRYAVAEEIAQVVLFLASDESSYVNGQNWAVDGGLSASHPVVPGKLM